MSGNPWPALRAFDDGDDLGVWVWTYRVWSGWRWPDAVFGLRWEADR